MKRKYAIFITAILAAVHYLVAGSAPIAQPARIAPRGRVAPIAPVGTTPAGAAVAPVAPVGTLPPVAPIAPVASPSLIAPLAPASVAPIPQSVSTNLPVIPSPFTFTSGAAVRLRNTNTNSVHPPYGNLPASYTNNIDTNNAIHVTLPYPISPMINTSSPSIQ